MQRVHNQTVRDEEIEINTEESTMTNSDTDNTGRRVITDGGTEIRNSDEVLYSDDDVRSYSADGHLYAYREDDEHVVVSRGNEPQTRWTKRVPAERDAVLAGEHLWTVPENWHRRINIKGVGASRNAIYRIPDTGVDVLVSVPNKNQLVDAWYGIERVGTLAVTYDNDIAWDKLDTTIEAVRDLEEVNDDVVEALEALNQRRRSFERKFTESVNEHAEDALVGCADHPVTVHQWTAEPWGDEFPISHLIQKFLDLDKKTRAAVLDILYVDNILPSYPTVRVDVEEAERIPDGYEIRALVEAGVSGVDGIDYLITEYYDLMTQADWAEIRGEEPSVINKNVASTEKKLSD